MGKVKKLKEERKKDRINEEAKREKKEGVFKKIGLISISSFLILGFVTFGYNNYAKKYFEPMANSAKEKIAKLTNKKAESKKEEKVKTYKTSDKKYSKVPDMQIDTKKKYIANFETTEGDFKVELFADKAPKTVNNFVVLSKDKFYDGLTFHRIIKDFMIQGGDPKGDGTGDPGYKFEDEKNDVALEKGILAMANSGPNTNGSQFFIITKDKTEWLQGKHTAFGKVTEGLDKVMNLEKVETSEGDKPKEAVKINKVTIEEK